MPLSSSLQMFSFLEHVSYFCCLQSTQREHHHWSHFCLPRLSCHVLPRIPLGLLWSCPTWSVSPTSRSWCCLAACWPSLWSAPSAKPSGSTSTAMMPGTWISTVRVPPAHAAPSYSTYFVSLVHISLFLCHFKFLNAGMCRVVFYVASVKLCFALQVKYVAMWE